MGCFSIVAIVPCGSYSRQDVSEAVQRAVSLIGPDLDTILPRSGPVLLKPNLLAADPPEKGSTTHPAVFGAVAHHLLGSDYELRWGDSPAFGSPEAVAKRPGILGEAERQGISMADFQNGQTMSFPGGLQHKRFLVARGACQCASIVNLPKLKTHGLTILTGAIKNMFGVVPGTRKAEHHVRAKGPESFMRMLVDLNRLMKPRLTIMDAVDAMEGNGPRNGSLVHLGLLIVSTDPVAVDATAARIMGLDPLELPLLRIAEQAGLGNAGTARIRIVGDSLMSHLGRRFALPVPARSTGDASSFLRVARRFLSPRPVIRASRCTACGTCVTACPVTPKALRQRERRVPDWRQKLCIRCYCCQEICPTGALSIHTPILLRTLWDSSPTRATTTEEETQR